MEKIKNENLKKVFGGMKMVVDATLWNCTKDEPCVLLKKNKSFTGGKFYKVCEVSRFKHPSPFHHRVSITNTAEPSDQIESELKAEYNIVEFIELDKDNQQETK